MICNELITKTWFCSNFVGLALLNAITTEETMKFVFILGRLLNDQRSLPSTFIGADYVNGVERLWNRQTSYRFIYMITEKHSPFREANNPPSWNRYIQTCRQIPEVPSNDTKLALLTI